MPLDINKTYAAILSAAKQRHFISYGDLADASGVPWSQARRPMPQQLGKLATIAHEKGWPLLSAIVVNKENLQSGHIDGTALEGFLSAAKMVGLTVDDPQAFVRDQQQKVFDWARSAPAELGVAEDGESGAAGPRFVQYFAPVLEALREFGGQARPEDVYHWVKDNVEVSEEEVSSRTKGGQSKFENKVGWARFYLAKAGLIDGAKRGLWVLTAEGRETDLDHGSALALFKDIQSRFKTADDEEEPAPDNDAPVHELFDDPNRRFWFVGAAWGGSNDQLDRFIKEGIWQNGYHDKFTDHVQRMRPGDLIAVKAAFVQKYKLPFENNGKPVSAMRIKAIGTVIENIGDGRTVKVQWRRVDPPKNWYLYTYRVTVVEADPGDDLARRLILFAFADARQDFNFWLKNVPYFAKQYAAATEDDDVDAVSLDDSVELETEAEAAVTTYTVDDIVADGCFLPKVALEQILRRAASKKNLILQGPPGTGKTWLAKKLAFALLGSKDRKVTRNRLRVVQFHPSLSYEDFIRGWRPSGDGRLALIDGVFLQSVQAAAAEPDRPFVLIIEEINRGNPAQIFGEMLTLLEDSKRGPEDAIELAYRRKDGERVSIPKNLHVFGTMNIADRSLALVDLALRRRFAFVSLDPQLNGEWRRWCIERCGLASDAVDFVEQRLTTLNQEIADDRSLGPQYRIGHSYVTPVEALPSGDFKGWFRSVSETEIIPLLEEYWFDAPDKVRAAAGKLLEGL